MTSIAFATYVHGSDQRGPGGWAAVIRRDTNTTTLRGHACHATHAELDALGRGLVLQSLMGEMHFFVVTGGPLAALARDDMDRARMLAKQAAVVVGVTTETV